MHAGNIGTEAGFFRRLLRRMRRSLGSSPVSRLVSPLRGSIDRVPGQDGCSRVAGWTFFDDGPVQQGWITWNGAPVADIQLGGARADVAQAFGGRMPWAASCSFAGLLDVGGRGELGVLAVGPGGRIAELPAVSFEFPYESLGVGAIEEPYEDAPIRSEDVLIRGWWTFANGPPRAGFLYIDDRPVMPVDLCVERQDLARRPRLSTLWPHVSRSGFIVRWRPDPGLAPGTHTIRIRFESPGGQEAWTGPRPISTSVLRRGEVRRWPGLESGIVEGWGLFDQGPVAQGFLCVEGEKTFELQIGLPTPDILNEFPQKPWAATAGFRCEVPYDRDWSKPELSVLLIGQGGQQRVLGPRDRSTAPRGRCPVAGIGADIDPVQRPRADDPVTTITGWAHRSGKAFSRLWLCWTDHWEWECQTGLPRLEVDTPEAIGFCAVIPTQSLWGGCGSLADEIRLTLRADSEYGPIDLLTVAVARRVDLGGELTAGPFDAIWRHDGRRLSVDISPRDREHTDTRPALVVNGVDVSSRLARDPAAPIFHYVMATGMLEGDSIELRLPDGGDACRATIDLTGSKAAPASSRSPTASSCCTALAVADGSEWVSIFHRSLNGGLPEASVIDDRGQKRGRGVLRPTAYSPGDPQGTRLFIGLLPGGRGRHVNLVEQGTGEQRIGRSIAIRQSGLRLDGLKREEHSVSPRADSANANRDAAGCAPPRQGRRVLFWLARSMRPASIIHEVALMKDLRASGWECRAVSPSASGVWSVLADAGVKYAIGPSSDQVLAEWRLAGGPFDSWSPEVIHVCGDGLEAAAAVYPSTAVPIVLSVDNDHLCGVHWVETSADVGRLSRADQRVAAFVTSSSARCADLGTLFGKDRVVLAEGCIAADASPESSTRATAETPGDAEHVIAVFIEPGDSVATAILLDALGLFKPDEGRRSRIRVLANSSSDDAAFINALHWVCRAAHTNEGVDVEVLTPDVPWHAIVPRCDCVTFLGPPDPAPLEILAAAARGIWAVSAAPCEYIEIERTQGEVLRSFTGVALADAWHDRVRERVAASSGDRRHDMRVYAAAVDEIYHRCLASAHHSVDGL